MTSVKRYKFSPAGKPEGFDFFKKLAPHTQEDLMVHPKKLQELEGWIKAVVQSSKVSSRIQIILVKGKHC